jgi:hypothetical protein
MVNGGHYAVCAEGLASLQDLVAVGGDEYFIDGFGAQGTFVGVLDEKLAGFIGENFPPEST